MRRNSLSAKLSISLLLTLFGMMQAIAAAQACEVAARGVEIATAGVHCQMQHELVCSEHLRAMPEGTPDVKAGWPDVNPPADVHASEAPHLDFVVVDARASRLSQFVPEVRNLSIALLNLRQ